MRPRSTMARRVSGNGETPNSIPRVSVCPFQGGPGRLQFSSQTPIHGKSDVFQTQPNARYEAGENATKNAVRPLAFIKCAVYALDRAALVNTRRSETRPSILGALGHSNTAPRRR